MLHILNNTQISLEYYVRVCKILNSRFQAKVYSQRLYMITSSSHVKFKTVVIDAVPSLAIKVLFSNS